MGTPIGTPIKGVSMKEILTLVAIIGIWVLIQTVILPKMGIAT